MKIVKQKRLSLILRKQTLLFIITLTISGLISCKNEAGNKGNAVSGEAAWTEDYEASPFIWGFIDPSGQFVIEPKFDDARDFSEGLAAANLNGKWGYINQKGSLVIPHIFQICGDFSEGKAVVRDFDNKTKVIDPKGRVLFPCLGEECGNYEQGFSIFSNSGMMGIMDAKGNPKLAAQFSDIKYGYRGQFIAQLGSLYGVIDTNGTWIVPAKAKKINLALEDKYIVHRENEVQMVEINGKSSKENYLTTGPYWDGYRVAHNSKGNHIIKVGGRVNYSTGHKLQSLGSERFAEWDGQNAYIIDANGKRLSETAYNGFLLYSEGLIGVMQGDYWGYVDLLGAEVLEPILPLAWDCKEGRIRYISQYGYGFLDKKGNPVIEAHFPEARDFHSGLARVAVIR